MEIEAKAIRERKERSYGGVAEFITSTILDATPYARYVTMRVLRLVLSYALLGGAMWSLLLGAGSLLWATLPALVGESIGRLREPWLSHPYLTPPALIALAVALVSLHFAIQVPYRMSTTMPGTWTYPCWRCGVRVRDELTCSNCKAFRPGRIVTGALWAVSLVITVMYIVVDGTIFVIGLLVGKK